MRYNAIAKLETFNEDINYIVDKLNLTGKLKIRHEHKTLGKLSSTDDFREKFAKISAEKLDKLYLKYKEDFDLFEYE